MDFLGFSISNPFRSHSPKGFYDAVKGHTGVDFSMPAGTPIQFPVDMVVRDFRVQNEMGNCLYLEDPDGRIVVLAHLQEIFVNVKDRVPAFTILAHSGNSGKATTGAHLHLEVIADKPELGFEMMSRTLGLFSGYNVDPVKVLEAYAKADWASEAMAWAREQGFITQDHSPSDPMTFGEWAVVSKRLFDKLHS